MNSLRIVVIIPALEVYSKFYATLSCNAWEQNMKKINICWVKEGAFIMISNEDLLLLSINIFILSITFKLLSTLK